MLDGLTHVNVSVGELAELCRKGDIHYRLPLHSSAQEGLAAHKLVQTSRPEFYNAEYPVEHEIVYGTYRVKVSGRLDGYMNTCDGFCIDEIKSVRLSIEDIPDFVLENFWRQAIFYAFMLADEEGLADIRIRLCFYHLDEEKEYRLERTYIVDNLRQKFLEAIMMLVDRLERRSKWCDIRSSANSTLNFPYTHFRPGQRDMAVSVFRQLNSGGQVVVQAPTGIGKTMGTIFPAVHALDSSEDCQRIFYLSAKSSAQQIAESAARNLLETGGRLRTLTITAKDKICFNKALPCDSEYCKFAKGYYDRIKIAIADMLEHQDQFDRQSVETFSKKHTVCPFQLSLDLSCEMDLIICDYNYVFDPSARLRQYFNSSQPDSLALVDEAHNLIDRGRDMFSAELEKSQFSHFAQVVKSMSQAAYRSACSVNRVFLAMRRADSEFERRGFLVQKELPEVMIKVLRKFRSEIEVVLAKQDRNVWSDELSNVYFQVERFIRTAEEYDHDYVTLLSRTAGKSIKLKLLCVDPSKRLASGFSRLAGAACFSATLQPKDYFRNMLGINDKDHWYKLPSPYPAKNLHVSVASYIDTSYRFRKLSIAPIVKLIETVTNSKPGGYMVFFPSFKYLKMVHEAYTRINPNKNVVTEYRSMDDEQRQVFLQKFDGNQVCGFAVMSGVFSESIDLKGDRLIGAIIIGVGLPGLGIERDIISQQFGGKGFEFAYQYPGIVRVIQTAGRVIRSDQDEGVICLVDCRFREERYKQLLPEHWQLKYSDSVDDLKRGLFDFWDQRGNRAFRRPRCRPDIESRFPVV